MDQQHSTHVPLANVVGASPIGRVLGFDVGVKNLSFCIIDGDLWASQRQQRPPPSNDVPMLVSPIVSWQNLDLTDAIPTCDAIVKKTNQRCGKKASIQIQSSVSSTPSTTSTPEWLCGIHGKQSPSSLTISTPSPRRGGLVRDLSHTERVKRMVEQLDRYRDSFSSVRHIVIELQPRMNPSMQMLSNALYGYLVTRYHVDNVTTPTPPSIEFSHPKNKLRVSYDGPLLECQHLKGTYARTKFMGTCYTRYLLRDHPTVLDTMFQRSKLDDLADAFLHCVYHVERCTGKFTCGGGAAMIGGNNSNRKRRKTTLKRPRCKRARNQNDVVLIEI